VEIGICDAEFGVCGVEVITYNAEIGGSDED
jgi:hypothetical protein